MTVSGSLTIESIAEATPSLDSSSLHTPSAKTDCGQREGAVYPVEYSEAMCQDVAVMAKGGRQN